ncbi:calpain-like protein [Achlya hypogyna]|uniref:Calpain-like protein n=1 Tax=Achlya hypogyna TaxID=1202772 RepID=A0A1V9YKY1_ACHHY|nr:calpain-like protein [Achlya hypogyna]
MFCGECGSRYDDATARFCAECGAPRDDVDITPAPAPPVPAARPAPTPAPTPVYPPPATTFSAPGPAYSAPAPTYTAPAYSVPGPAYSSPGPAYPAPSQPAYAPGPTPSAKPPTITPTLAPTCVKCATPFVDPAEMFCGECGYRRQASPPAATPAPVVASAAVDDDDDLFGGPPSASASLHAAAPPMAPPSMASMPPPEPAEPKPAFTTSFPGAHLAAAQLAGLTLKASQAEPARLDTHGTGDGISFRTITQARDIDSLGLRQAISATMDRNRTAPDQVTHNYHSSKVNANITVHHNMNTVSEEEQWYSSRSAPDGPQWLELLRQHRQNKTQFTDPQFPPTNASLYRDPTRPNVVPGTTPLDSIVWKWKRISDFFSTNAYVEVTMLDDDKKLISAIALKSAAEAESMIATIREQHDSTIDARFLLRAQEAVELALTHKKREHMLLLTTPLIQSMSEYVDGVQKYELLWQRSLLDQNKPLVYQGVGSPSGYRLEGMGVNRVSVLVPVQFQAQHVCVFDRHQRDVAECKAGRLADGYLFGALSMLTTSPTLVAQLFPVLTPDLVDPTQRDPDVSPAFALEQQYNEEGIYCVRFWRNHKSYLVIVDDYIPCSQYGKPVFASFTGSSSRFEIWSMLVEKAYAKLHGGYDAILGGQEAYCLQDLWGGIPTSLSMTQLPNTDTAYSYLTNALHHGHLVGFCNDQSEAALPLGLKAGHTYGLLRLLEVTVDGGTQYLVQLRNTWGDVDKDTVPARVPWAKGSAEWKRCTLRQKQDAGYTLNPDFTLWLPLDACLAFFSTVLESKNLYQFPAASGAPLATGPPVSVHVVSGAWTGATAGGREAVHLNPQYQLLVPASTSLAVHLEQPSRRLRMQMEYPCFVAPIVTARATPAQRKLDIGRDVVATGTFISNRSCFLGLDAPLAADTYVVIPATYAPFETSFQLALFTSAPVALLPIADNDIPICCVCHRPLTGAYRSFETKDGTVQHVCKDTCAEQYRQQHTLTCIDCGQRIEVVPGVFSGRLFTLPDGTACHAECIDAYRIRTAESCRHCHMAITPIPGKFDGKYFQLDVGKVHAECMAEYQLSIAKRCKHCGQAIVKNAQFDGRFYQIANSEDQVHFECWEAYQASVAPRCRHCLEPILRIEGRFDGRFYDLNDGTGKVHFECWDAFRLR